MAYLIRSTKIICLYCVLLSALSSTVTGAEPDLKNAPMLNIETNRGNIVIALAKKQAPTTVQNFINYVKDDFYDETIFHRVIENFMIQGGGLTESLYQKPGLPPVKNESKNGLSNKRGSIAMARTNDPDSATSQFFINVSDNKRLDGDADNYGYTVFAYVVKGMSVVDRISRVATASRGMHNDVPIEPVKIIKITYLTEE